FCGGEGNPLGARALYLGDTLYRIHGTNQPSTILWLLDRPPARAMTHTGTERPTTAAPPPKRRCRASSHTSRSGRSVSPFSGRSHSVVSVRSTLRRASGAAGIMLPRTQ